MNELFNFSTGNLTRQFYFGFENEIEDLWQVDIEVKKNHYIDQRGKAISGKDGTQLLLGSHFLDPEEWLILFGAVHTCWEMGSSCLVFGCNNFPHICFKLGLSIGIKSPTKSITFFEELGEVFF